MSSIGPQLPSQPSAKRKHTPEPGDDHNVSSSSKHARRNADEINLDDDASSDSDSDDYGPRAPAAAPIDSKPSLGPLLPPPAPSTRNQDEIDLDDSASSSSSSHTGPAPPPPPPPPPPPSHATASTAQPIPADSDSDSGSDSDDYGPALPSASNTRRGPIGPTLPPTTDPSAPKRDEWMLAPPVNTGYTERDPTKLKARKFTSSKPGRGGGGGGPSSSSDSSGLAAIWTETPEEKLKRLQDAVLGRSDASGQSAEAAAAAAARTRHEDERNSKVAAAIAAHRGRSLYDEHQAGKNGGGGSSEGGSGGKNKKTGKGGEEEDDPSKRAFDREKDMALGSKIGTAQRRELVAKSANFGGRFQKGSFL